MRLSKNIKNSLLLITEKIVLIGLSFLNSVLIARIAGPDFFGSYSYILSFGALFLPLTVMGLNNLTSKYFIKHPKNSHYYFLAALKVRFSGAIFSLLLGSCLAYWFFNEVAHIQAIILLLCFQVFNIFNLVEYYYLAKQKVSNTLYIRLSILLITKLVILFSIINNASLITLIALNGAEFILLGSCYLFIYYKNKQHQHIKKQPKFTASLSLFNKSKWLFFSGIAAVIYLKIDQLMIAHILNTKEVAFYAAAAKLSEFWYVFPVLIANAFNAQLTSTKLNNARKYKQLLLKILSFMVSAACLISITTFLFSDQIINVLFGEQYSKSAKILQIHIFASIFIFQRAILSKWLIIEGHYKFSLYTTGCGAVLNVLLNLWLIPNYGGVGAAWATLMSYMMASMFSLALFKHTRPFFLLMVKAMLKWPSILLNSYTIANRKHIN
ncbi:MULTISPECIES: flippase [unclassified Pseudoalteromonas]|uniref:flippase n=1 Tax=unclassified Pseudoalteromonas TaxID=194690 RepID=UPI0005A70CA4|nr:MULTISPECIES: flippase [unclassified Pseudoalteromonas]